MAGGKGGYMGRCSEGEGGMGASGCIMAAYIVAQDAVRHVCDALTPHAELSY